MQRDYQRGLPPGFLLVVQCLNNCTKYIISDKQKVVTLQDKAITVLWLT